MTQSARVVGGSREFAKQARRAGAPALLRLIRDRDEGQRQVPCRLCTSGDVRIDNGAIQPDLRIQVVDAVESADFALVDDVVDAGRSACRSDGLLETEAAKERTLVRQEKADAPFRLRASLM